MKGFETCFGVSADVPASYHVFDHEMSRRKGD